MFKTLFAFVLGALFAVIVALASALGLGVALFEHEATKQQKLNDMPPPPLR